MKWTAKTKATAQQMFDNGITAAVIAKRLKTTRSTVLGKLKRMGTRRSSVQSYLGVPEEWQVREKIKHEIVLMPNSEDIKKAKPRDPRACALHNAACRVFNVPNCAIGGRWAYIPQRDSKGETYIARMQAPQETQRAIQHFDKTGEMPEGGFRFMPIADSHRYKAKNAYNATHRMNKAEPDKKRPNTKRRTKVPMRSMPHGLRTD